MRLRRVLGGLVLLARLVQSRLPLPHFGLQDVAYHREMRVVCGCNMNGLPARVLALSSNGDLRWSVEIPSLLAHSHDSCATRLVVTSDGIYTTGFHANATRTTLFVAKLSVTGALTWVRRFGDEGKHRGLGLAVSLDGSMVYVVGTSHGVIARHRTRGDDMIVLQMRASDGDTIWSQLLDSDNHGDDQAFSVDVDATGHVYLVGQTNGRFEPDGSAVGDALHGGDLVVLSLDANGHRRWTRQVTEADGCSDDDPRSQRRCGLILAASSVFVVGATAGAAFLDPTQWPPDDDQTTPCVSSRCLNTVLVQLHLDTGAIGWTNQLLLDDVNVGQCILQMDPDTVTVVGTIRGRDDDVPHVLIAQFAAVTGTHLRVFTDATTTGVGVAAVVGAPGTLLLGATTRDASYLDQRSTHDVTMTLPFCTNYVSFMAAVTHVASTNWTHVNPVVLAIRRHNAQLCTESVTVRYTISSADVVRPFTPASPHKAFVPITGDVRLDVANPTVVVQLAAAPPSELPPLSALTVTLHASDDSTDVQDPVTHVIVLLGTPSAEPTTQHVQVDVLYALVCALGVFGGLLRCVCHCRMGLWSDVQYRHVEEAPGERQLPLKRHLQLLRGDAAAVGGHSVHDGAVRPAMVASPGRPAKPKCKRARRPALLPHASADALRDAND